jgi:molybdate transport system substrate-binding protein
MFRAVFLLLGLPLIAAAQTRLSVAAAANFVYVLEPLHAEFKRTAPDIELTVNTGASGTLVAQIKNGAPFDVFLSADTEYPRELIKAGGAAEKSFTLFTIGRLVLWTTRADLDLTSVPEAIYNPKLTRLAIANPRSAPYGRAALEALRKLGLAPRAEPKLVYAENITQTAQFVETGNADAGFVALSLVRASRLQSQGRWIEVNDSLHPPLEHAGVVTRRGESNPAAARYLEFLLSPAAQAILEKYGYRSPAKK